MECLPVEIIRIVFELCDSKSARNLRLACRAFACLGCDYLLRPHLIVAEYKDGLHWLRYIANHDRLRHKISSVTFNFVKLDDHSARHALFQYWVHDPEERAGQLQKAWDRYPYSEKKGDSISLFHYRTTELQEAFRNLPYLKDLKITYSKCPDSILLPEGVFAGKCRKRDRAQAVKNMNAIVSAVRHAQFNSLSIDQLPMEVFSTKDNRRHWLDCGPSFANLTRLDLVLDPPVDLLPAARERSIVTLGHVLQFMLKLTSLSLRFNAYHEPRAKLSLSFRDLLGTSFYWPRLSDLKLEGLSCAEADLRSFLVRHGQSLKRLRLGGRGLAKPYETSIGGLHLHQGTFRSFFVGLQGQLPRLERLHMEGDFDGGELLTRSREKYLFHPSTCEDWSEIDTDSMLCPAARVGSTMNSLAMEHYLTKGGEFPRLIVVSEA